MYNTNETEIIIKKSREQVKDLIFDRDVVNICSVGKIVKTKGYDRLARVHKSLIEEGIKHHIYIFGIGEDEKIIKKYIKENNIEDSFTLVGFRENPYKYVSRCDLFICSSLREGFSTSVTESLIVGTPVISTLCSGAKELLGYNNEYGLVVENSEYGIYKGLKTLLKNRDLIDRYKKVCIKRAEKFSKKETVL